MTSRQRVEEIVQQLCGGRFTIPSKTALKADLGFDSLDLHELEIELGIEFNAHIRLGIDRQDRDMTFGELLNFVTEHTK